MKMIFTLLSCIFSSLVHLQASTVLTPQSIPTSNSLYTVCFTDQNHGWAGGDDGMFYTTDGGNTWNQQGGVTQPLFSITFSKTNPSLGWAAGTGGVILYTTDGGTSWSAQSSSTTNDLFSIEFSDNSNGWAVGAGGVILHTSNGGSQWDVQSVSATNDLYSVSFSGSNTGYAVGSSGIILATTDGGNTWGIQSNNNIYDLNSVYFTSSSIGYAVGTTSGTPPFVQNGIILKTTDGGSTWVQQSSPAPNNINQVIFTDANNGWAVGEGGEILNTTDGGINWALIANSNTNGLLGISPIDAGNNSIVGELGTAFKATNSGSTLPVKLVAFSGVLNGNAVQLNWKTATEYGNKGYEIFRAADGSNWESVGFVNSKGNSDRMNDYTFTDHPPVDVPYNIYRLKQEDLNGNFVFSNVVLVNMNSKVQLYLTAFPNPAQENFIVNYSISDPGLVSIKLYNSSGRLVINALNQKQEKGEYQVNLSTSQLSKGIYYCQLETGKLNKTIRIVIN